jgi:hypothetical protein
MVSGHQNKDTVIAKSERANLKSKSTHSSHSVAIVAILLVAIIILPVAVYFYWPYVGWAQARIRCGQDPFLGIEQPNNINTGRPSKSLTLPGDSAYYTAIGRHLSNWESRNHYFFCSEKEANLNGYLTNDQIITPYVNAPAPVQSGLYESIALQKTGYTKDSEAENLDNPNQSGNVSLSGKAYPIYSVDYFNSTTALSESAVYLFEFPLTENVPFLCNSATLFPHVNRITSLFSTPPTTNDLVDCSKLGVTKDGKTVFGASTDLGSKPSIYFSLKDRTVIAVNVTEAHGYSPHDFTNLMDSLLPYVPNQNILH